MRTAAVPCNLLFLALLAWIVYLADTGQQGRSFTFVRAIPHGDKIGHFFLFGLLALLVSLALAARTIRLRQSPLSLGSLLFFAGTLPEETGQHFIPSRSFGLEDMLANTLGILAFTTPGHFFLL